MPGIVIAPAITIPGITLQGAVIYCHQQMNRQPVCRGSRANAARGTQTTEFASWLIPRKRPPHHRPALPPRHPSPVS